MYTQVQVLLVYKVTQTLTALVVLLSLLGIFSLCVFTFSSMKTGEMWKMTGCSLSNTAVLCSLSAAQHLQFWRQIFVPASPMALLLALVIVAAAFLVRQVIDPLHAVITRFKYSRWQLLYESTLLLGDYLKQAFSQGILHPKIY